MKILAILALTIGLSSCGSGPQTMLDPQGKPGCVDAGFEWSERDSNCLLPSDFTPTFILEGVRVDETLKSEVEKYAQEVFPALNKGNLEWIRLIEFDTPLATTAAQCRSFDGWKGIEVNNTVWKDLSDNERKTVIFHELGHCNFDLSHDDGPKVMEDNVSDLEQSDFNDFFDYIDTLVSSPFYGFNSLTEVKSMSTITKVGTAMYKGYIDPYGGFTVTFNSDKTYDLRLTAHIDLDGTWSIENNVVTLVPTDSTDPTLNLILENL